MANEPADPAVDGSRAEGAEGRGPARSRDEVALELMKFVAVTTGYGKGTGSGAGFSGKTTRSPEEYADALLQLFERCRVVVAKEPQK
ncbi:MAG TPA: hypothetical protein VK335_21905 [Bryobacteraceae bacterium]|nr:hypothetical protein [Bryobacteraceae bacterium]